MSAQKAYTVTERAGPYVAGRRVTAGTTLMLSDAEAAYELREGTIARDAAAAPASKPARKAVDKASKGEEAV